MAKQDYLPNGDIEKAKWLANFSEKLKAYQTPFAISDDSMLQLKTDTDVFVELLNAVNQLKESVKAFVAFKDQLRDGKKTLGTLPVLPTFDKLPDGTQSDIFGRVRLLVKTIKLNPNYTEAIGKDLDIIGEENHLDPSTLKPQINVKTGTGGHPVVLWSKGQTSGVKIKVDRCEGRGFEFLAVDTHPDYHDTHALPPFGQSAVWKYTAIYLMGDDEAGQWSDIVSLSVSGQP